MEQSSLDCVQTRRFNGHGRAGDLLSQVRSRLRLLAYALVAATLAGTSCSTIWHVVYELLVVVTRGRVWFIRTLTLAANFMAPACRYLSMV